VIRIKMRVPVADVDLSKMVFTVSPGQLSDFRAWGPSLAIEGNVNNGTVSCSCMLNDLMWVNHEDTENMGYWREHLKVTPLK
jgi:hypothetical protein